eukprot:4381765-Amphidinium_carterae.2
MCGCYGKTEALVKFVTEIYETGCEDVTFSWEDWEPKEDQASASRATSWRPPLTYRYTDCGAPWCLLRGGKFNLVYLQASIILCSLRERPLAETI